MFSSLTIGSTQPYFTEGSTSRDKKWRSVDTKTLFGNINDQIIISRQYD
jgi:hypothetical protein